MSTGGALKGSTAQGCHWQRASRNCVAESLLTAGDVEPKSGQRIERVLAYMAFVLGRGGHVSFTMGPKPVSIHRGSTRDVLVIGTKAALSGVATRWDVSANALRVMGKSGELVDKTHGPTKLTGQVVHVEELACVRTGVVVELVNLNVWIRFLGA
jgi:hypothetical protein